MSIENELDSLKKEIEQFNLYIEKEKKRLISEYEIAKDKYDNIVSVINCERSLLRYEIKDLYDFLGIFGDIGTKITPFDFSFESYLIKEDEKETKKINSHLNFKNKNAFGALSALPVGFMGIGGIPIAAAGPALLNPIGLILGGGMALAGLFLNHKNDKEYLQRKIKDFNEKKIELNNIIKQYENNVQKIIILGDIAEKYYHTLVIVRDAIHNEIIPELQGVKTFLYVATIKEYYISKKTITNIVPQKISVFKNTIYDRHFKFVQNSFDFYILVKNFYTRSILTELIQEDKISEEKLIELEHSIDEIISLENDLSKKTTFIGN